jgi:hypothetical protein
MIVRVLFGGSSLLSSPAKLFGLFLILIPLRKENNLSADVNNVI